MTPIPNYPRLVQHLRYTGVIENPYQPRRYTDLRPGETFGVSSLFRFEYMGRAEYEWGALPTAREILSQSMAEANWPAPMQLKQGTHSCWFVGPANHIQVARVFFAEELADDRAPYTKEYTGLQRSYLNPDDRHSPEGWWVLLPLPGFAVFKTQFQSQEFIRALRDHK